MSEFSLDIPKIGHIIAYRHKKGFFGNLIRKAQMKAGFDNEDSYYTHVEVSGGGPWAVCIVAPRSKVVNITKRYKNRFIKIFRYKDIGYYKKRYKVAFWAATLCNTRYDWWGVVRFKLQFLFHKKNLWFCSEGMAWALQKEFPLALDKPPQDCMPADFLNPKFFELVWEGVIP